MRARIADRQISEHITAKLWQYGLLPGLDFTLQTKAKDSVHLDTAQGQIELPKDVARQINVELKAS
jgi:Fe2+ transport system protein FeoA